MRHLAVLLLAAPGIFAADFQTGQAARAIIGQPTFTKEWPESSDSILGGAGAVAYSNGRLIIADSNRLGAPPANPRVLIYNNLSQWLPSPTAEIPKVELVRCPVCVGTGDVIMGKQEMVDGKLTYTIGLTNNSFRLPVAVATDGVRMAVADADNNRVLIWNSIPNSKDQPADVVVGQPDFQTDCPNSVGPRDGSGACTGDVRVPSARSLRGPQGVWIQGNRLFVADDQNHRVLIWNSMPAQNFAPADVVLGAPNFTTAIEPDLTKKEFNVKPDTMLNPVSVTSDGQRLFVADLGHNRVLVWNTIPTSNAQPADFAIGQPDLTSAVANNSPKLCASEGKDADGNDIYPQRCAATLDFPRFALSDGQRLFVADGGNDRVLIFNSIPQQSGQAADVILGQINDIFTQTSDNEENPDVARRAAPDALRTPTSLAWDGTNLFVADPFHRRVLVFSPSTRFLPLTGIRNGASFAVYAVGSVTLGGTITENNEVTAKIRDKKYTYKIKKDDTFQNIVDALVSLINAGDGDPWVTATPNYALNAVILTSKIGGPEGNNVETAAEVSKDATITATAGGTNLAGGQDAARLAPGTLISIFADGLADLAEGEVIAAPDGMDPLPLELGGVQVYIDGVQAPILAVTRNQVNAQLPFEMYDSKGVNAYVRTRLKDGSVTATTPLALPIVPANPGIFAYWGSEPRQAIALHGSSHAVGTIYVEGVPKAGDKITVNIEDRSYTYTAVEGDTKSVMSDKMIEMINANDPRVFAVKAGQFDRIRLRARVAGPEGNGITYSASSDTLSVGGTTGALCCASVEGAPITEQNPAIPGENIIVYATGLGMVEPDEAKFAVWTGHKYQGPVPNKAVERMDSLAGGKTANVLYMGMVPGTVGIYEIHLELLSDLPTNPATQLTVAQDIYVSNIVTLPVRNPNPPAE